MYDGVDGSSREGEENTGVWATSAVPTVTATSKSYRIMEMMLRDPAKRYHALQVPP